VTLNMRNKIYVLFIKLSISLMHLCSDRTKNSNVSVHCEVGTEFVIQCVRKVAVHLGYGT
jgi:hypothetical protein